ncbi:MAG: phosphoglycolate phosphatase, partial [Nitrosomonas sp.]|nr:phosphoglycolate phosphatase [Nitrosomonas sp.]
MIKAVLFDFDGTLADTAPDLGRALNRQRVARNRSPLPIELIRTEASAGARGLLNLGFNLKPGDPEYQAMREEFLSFYTEQLCQDTRLFPG